MVDNACSVLFGKLKMVLEPETFDRIKGWETKVGFSISKKDEDESDLRDQRTWATNRRLVGKKET